jgi:lysophospholipase L1-like esterase
VCVVNFGESAYVSLQGMIQLALQLRAGARPNAVVFYDGINDVGTTWQFGRAGSHSDQSDIAAAFERRSAVRQLAEQTSTYAVLRQSFAPVRRDTFPVAGLADSVVHNYLGVTEVVRALGKAYGFRTLFFWQPALSESGKVMTALEKRDVGTRARRHLQLFAETYTRMRAIAARDSADDLHDLSSVLADMRGDVFLDQAHLTPDGNARVAAAMLRAWDGLPDCTAPRGCAPAALAAR